MANPHRNRTLVINNKSGALPTTQMPTEDIKSEAEDGNDTTNTANGWVTKRDRHMQLINTSIYDKETQVRNKAIEDTRKQKALRRDHQEKQKIERHLTAVTPHPSYGAAKTSVHEITLNGLRFQVIDGGSKLARIRGEDNNEGESMVSSSHF